ncbi:DUF4160 domain-containing protein [bacterium]|nr:DUF4160 domain-containing protein [bacterium]
MPKISFFYGIDIYMYYDDHVPEHFHAIYGEFEAIIGIDNLSVIAGFLPPRALGLVIEWAAAHKNELKENWLLTKNQSPLKKIEPLK